MSAQATHPPLRRQIGPFRAYYKANARHVTALKKTLELFTIEEILDNLGSVDNLRVSMGRNYTLIGRISTHRVSSYYNHNGSVLALTLRTTDGQWSRPNTRDQPPSSRGPQHTRGLSGRLRPVFL
jgi:hypothetical protein